MGNAYNGQASLDERRHRQQSRPTRQRVAAAALAVSYFLRNSSLAMALIIFYKDIANQIKYKINSEVFLFYFIFCRKVFHVHIAQVWQIICNFALSLNNNHGTRGFT
jgi:hypothetical protein